MDCPKCFGIPGYDFHTCNSGEGAPSATEDFPGPEHKTYRDGLLRAAEIADGILNKYARYARPRSMAVAEEIKQAILKEANSPQQEGE